MQKTINVQKKGESILTQKIVTVNRCYLMTIAGHTGLLMNKIPETTTPPGEEKKQTKLTHHEREEMSWRDKLYYREDIGVHIPGENLHESFKEGAKYWGQRIPGEGMKTYTDLVASAVVVEDAPLGSDGPMRKDDPTIVAFGKMVNSTPTKGKKGTGRVYRIRPLIIPWEATFKMHVYDERLTPEVLQTIITFAGQFKGVCDWRPQYGRYGLVDMEEIEYATTRK